MGTVLDDRGLQAAGRALESARLAAGRTLDQVAASLGVRLPYLEALESGEFSRILGPTYAESMIVRYAVYLGLNPESLLSTATTPITGTPPPSAGAKPTSETPPQSTAAQSATELPAPSAPTQPAAAQSAAAVPATPEAPVKAKSAPMTVGARPGGPAVARRANRARSGGWLDALRARSPLFRAGIVSLSVLALVALGLFLSVQLGVLSLFGAGGATAADPSSPSVAIAATESSTTVTSRPTPVVSTTGAGTVTTVTSPTTTVPTTPSRPVTTQPPPAPVTFSLLLTAKEDVWVEFRDAASDTTLKVGIITKGDSVSLEAAGPVNAVVGKPGALSLEVNGRAAEPPNSYRWVIDSTGVDERP